MSERTVERDRKLSHAVETVWTFDLSLLSGLIEEALSRVNQRALDAGMIIMSTTLTSNASHHRIGEDQEPIMVVSVICQWVERDKLEAMQRQQRLMGGGGNHRP